MPTQLIEEVYHDLADLEGLDAAGVLVRKLRVANSSAPLAWALLNRVSMRLSERAREVERFLLDPGPEPAGEEV